MASLSAAAAAASVTTAASAARFLPPVTSLSYRSSVSLSSASARSSPLLPRFFHPRKTSSRRFSRIGYSSVSSSRCAVSNPEQMKDAREDIKDLLRTKFCHPIFVRLGWHDASTYNKNIEEWPQRGGANGSLRFEIELKHGANAGLVNALKLLQPIKDKYSSVTFADLFQLASATAIEESRGPKIPMKYGRVDVSEPEQCPEEGRLPDAGPPSPAAHLRDVFYRMGLNDKEYAEKYAADQDAFFKDYAEAHAKLSNLGAKFNPPERELSDAMKQKIRAEYEGLGGSPDKPLQSNYFLNIMIVIFGHEIKWFWLSFFSSIHTYCLIELRGKAYAYSLIHTHVSEFSKSLT